MADVEDAAKSLGLNLRMTKASTELELETAFADLSQEKIGAALVVSDPFFTSRRDQIATLAKHHAMAAMFELREYADAGGLMS